MLLGALDFFGRVVFWTTLAMIAATSVAAVAMVIIGEEDGLSATTLGALILAVTDLTNGRDVTPLRRSVGLKKCSLPH